MPDAGLRLESLDITTAPEATLRALARHQEALRAERMPEDPPHDEDGAVAELRERTPEVWSRRVLLWAGGEVVASAGLTCPLTQNTHLAFADLGVRAPWRGQGLGRRLLAELLAAAEGQGRRTLLAHTSSRVPAGEAVARHLGATPALEQQFMELDLERLTPDLLTRWTTEAAAAAPGYRVWQNLGAYQADRLAEIASLHDVMNTAPNGERDIEAWQTTPERLREADARMTAAGRQRLSTFAEHAESGQLVAFTELYWDTSRAATVIQHATAVRPEHRRHALGRWIKAANLQALSTANPRARFVRAGNAQANTGMLSINGELGFRTYATHTDWQIETATLRAALTPDQT